MSRRNRNKIAHRLRNLKFNYVGNGEDGRPVLDGAQIFRMMDEVKVPLGDMISDLHEQDMGFDIMSFLLAAKGSGHYTRTEAMKLFDGEEEEVRQAVREMMDIIWPSVLSTTERSQISKPKIVLP